MRRTRELSFDDVGSLSYSTLRHHVNGVYSGTTVTVSLHPQSGRSEDCISYRAIVAARNTELERFRDALANEIAVRMATRLRGNEKVEWTPGLRFDSQGLAYQTKKSFRQQETWTSLPFEAITLFDIIDDRLHIWTNFQERAVVSVSTAEPNFHAGYALLKSVCGESICE